MSGTRTVTGIDASYRALPGTGDIPLDDNRNYRNLIATIGTSTIARGEVLPTGNGATKRTWGGIGNVANILSGGRFYIPQSYSRAVSGQTSNHMVNTQLPEVLALNPRPRGCLVLGTSNDVSGSINWDVTQANYNKIIKTLKQVGIQPIICVPQPVLDFTATQQKQMARMANFLRDLAFATPGVVLVEPPASIVDPAPTTYEPLAAIMDTVAPKVHLNHLGTLRYAVNLVLAMANAGWLPVNNAPFVSNGNTFDAVHNPRGNLLGNGMLTGTGGSVFNATTNPTGSIAAGWQITGNNVGGAIAVAPAAGNGMAITVSGTSNGPATGIIVFRDVGSTELAGVKAGDTVEFMMEASWTNLVNVKYIGLMGRVVESGVTYDDIDGDSVSNAGPTDAVTSAVFRTVPRKCVAAPTQLRPRLFIYPEAAGPWSGTITFKSCAVRKV